MYERMFGTSAGVGIHLASAREGGRPAILLHGVTRRWQDWLTVLPSLAPRWQAFALDLRGHGKSDRTPGAYRIADYVHDVVDFLRRGLDEPAVVIGHSLGANVAVAVAAEAPERVHALVIEDPPLEMAGPRIVETGLLELFPHFLRHAGSSQSVDEIAEDLAEARVRSWGHAVPVRLGDVRDLVSLRVSASGLKQLDPGVLEPPLEGRWLEGSNVADDLGRIRCPTLLLQADGIFGGLLPDAHAAEMASLIRHCVHIKLTGIGHSIHSTATEDMMRLVLPFLGSTE